VTVPNPTAQAQTQPSPAPWPDGVLARYLTLAGATVDITATTEPDEPYVRQWPNGTKGQPQECIKLTLLAECQGCKDNDESTYDGLFATVMGRILQSPYGRDAQRWAQGHAETCRALPRPTQ
jgi:hypothetical protein